MFNKLKTLGLFAAVLLFSLVHNSAFAQSFSEGEHYFTLQQPLKSASEVRELFSFYCPHCYSMEPFVAQLKKALPNTVKFVKNHVTDMPGRDRDVEQLLSKAIISASLLGVEQQVAEKIFNAIHQQKQNNLSEDQIAAMFVEVGIDKQKFLSALSSFQVKMLSAKQTKVTDKMRQQGYSKVPTFVVHGKYVPNINNISSMQQYQELLLYLANKQD